MASIGQKLKNAWNAFSGQSEEERAPIAPWAMSTPPRPGRVRMNFTNEKKIVSSIYTRIGIDVAAIDIQHARLDENGRYLGEINSTLNDCLSLKANIDQGARAFRQDMAMTLFDEGVIAIVPVDVTDRPTETSSYDILSLRVGTVIEWYPTKVRVKLYNDRNGKREEVTLPKSYVAIVENPLYSVMNDTNSTLKRLVQKLALLDAVDQQSGSGKLDLIIQLPYVIKSEARKLQAEQRRKDIEFQLKDSQYGIAYTDGTEKVTQLNRPSENNLMAQVQYLTDQLYNELGLTPEIFNGTADEQAMINYYNRTIDPILSSITEAMKASFLTRTAITQGQSIAYFRQPFKLVPVSDLAEIADKFTRNEILTSNEVRAMLGFRPVNTPAADELRNSNIPGGSAGVPPPNGAATTDTAQ